MKDWATPLYVTCVKGHEACTQLLEDGGADVDQAKKDDTTPLWIACHNRHEACARLLVEGGADPNKADSGGLAPLYVACQNGHEACVQLLVDGGADINQAKSDGATPLWIACKKDHAACARLLVEGGADASKARSGQTPLKAAEEQGHHGIVALLREASPSQLRLLPWKRRKQKEGAGREQREAEKRRREEEGRRRQQEAAKLRREKAADREQREAVRRRREEEGKRRQQEAVKRRHQQAARRKQLEAEGETRTVAAAMTSAQSTCAELVAEVEALPPQAFREAASMAMGAAGAAVDALSGALAHAGTIFPPAVIPATFLKLFTLCGQIRQRYKQHMAVLDKDLPDLRERVEALEGGLKDLARLRVLAKGPDALERLLTEADELCCKCLAEGRKGEAGFKALAQRTWTFMRSSPKHKRELFEDMHKRLSQTVGDLAFLVQLRTYEANRATQAIAGEQRITILTHLQRVDDLQQRLARSGEADKHKRNQMLHSLQQTAEATKRAAEAGRDAAERNGDKLDDTNARLAALERLIREGAKASSEAAGEGDGEALVSADIPSSLLRPWSDVRDRSDPSKPLDLGQQPLGRGGFGVVFRAKLRCVGDTFDNVAVKMLDVSELSPEDGEAFQREVAMQVQCAGHANVLGVRGVVGEPQRGRYALIMDLCLCSLHAVVHHHKAVSTPFGSWSWRKLGLADKVRRLLGVVEAVAFMHQMRVAHNDLKPENVLVHARTGSFAVTDFGLARTAGTITRTLSGGGPGSKELRQHRAEDADEFAGGTLPYMAPEQLGPGAKVRREADVFALGALLFEALDTNPPPPIKTRKEAMERAKSMQLEMDMEDLLEEERQADMGVLCALLRETWHVDRKKRPTAMQLSDRLVELLANAEYAPPAASIASASSGAAVASTPAKVSAVRTAAPSDVTILSGGGVSPSSPSVVKSELVAYAKSTPVDEWRLEDAAKAARIEGAVEALEVERLQDLLDVDPGEDAAELEGVKGLQRRRFFREVGAFQAFVSSGEG